MILKIFSKFSKLYLSGIEIVPRAHRLPLRYCPSKLYLSGIEITIELTSIILQVPPNCTLVELK